MLTRDEFREKVFARDKDICVVPDCSEKAVDAHHIMERKLWKDEGYYMENGASLCENHHRMAEANVLPPQTLRYWLGLDTKIPPQLDSNKDYNKWGEELKKPDELRNYIKYCSTPYLPFSETLPNRERGEAYVDSKNFVGFPVVKTIKMDGSNVQLTNEYVAARNAICAAHKSFDMLKGVHATIKHKIPENIQVFGEWLYAKHSIHYVDDLALDNYLMIFAVYDKKLRLWYGWKEVEEYAKKLGVTTVPVIETKKYSTEYEFTKEITRTAKEVIEQGHEGIVIRSIYPYHFSQSQTLLGKYVRLDHVQTDKHWSAGKIIKNELKNNG